MTTDVASTGAAKTRARKLSYAIMWAHTPDGPRLLLVDPAAPGRLRALLGRLENAEVIFEAGLPGNADRELTPIRHGARRLLPRFVPSDIARDASELAGVLPHGPRFKTVDWGDVYRLAQSLADQGVTALATRPQDVRLAPFDRIQVVPGTGRPLTWPRTRAHRA